MFNNFRCKDFDIVLSKHRSKNTIFIFFVIKYFFCLLENVKDFQPSKHDFDQVIFSVVISQQNQQIRDSYSLQETQNKSNRFFSNWKSSTHPKYWNLYLPYSIKSLYFAGFFLMSPVQG
jgi:hypothetical protein